MSGVEIPKRLRLRPRDARGYVIPWVVAIDRKGTPHFVVNDHQKSAKAVRSKLCAICGKRMQREDGYWFIGGPASALTTEGRFIDTPTHEECARYAIRVCPYLAAPRYAKRIGEQKVRQGAVVGMGIFFDPSVDAARPPLFCLGKTSGFSLSDGDAGLAYLNPVRPWLALEFWCQGERLTEQEARPIAEAAIRRALRHQWPKDAVASIIPNTAELHG